MRVWLLIEAQEGVTWPQWLALAQACEEEGVEGLASSDHLQPVYRSGDLVSFDPWVLIGALAARTTRLRLGTLVSPVTFRHPAILARNVLTVDQVSSGRVEVGLGAGWSAGEHERFGLEFDPAPARLALLAEHLEIVHGLLGGEEVRTEQGRYRLEGARAHPPLRRPHPPILLGGDGGPAALRLAARWADEYNTFPATPEVSRTARLNLERACAQVGRDPATVSLSVTGRCLVGTDRKDVLERTRRVLALTGEQGEAETLLRARADAWLAGPVPELAERLRTLEAAGVSRVFLQLLDHADLDAVRLIGQQLIPGLSSLQDPHLTGPNV
jgi:alkanesulfonate monooxygenase SsuD/methylene tetrahydromethanopterin reductase-like flavin-dependent oxidoreductase (luciferase family)